MQRNRFVYYRKMFDVFYFNKPSGLFVFEQAADSIHQAAEKSRTEFFWYIDGTNNLTTFDFDWMPQPGQENFVHVFPCQWHKWGNVFFARTQHVQTLDPTVALVDSGVLNYTDAQQVTAANNSFEIYYVDHGNKSNNLEDLVARFPQIRVTRFVDNYLDTFKRIASNSTAGTVWIVSSLCDYTDFDFTWYPDPWQAEMLHCFGTPELKKGDTFYMNVPEFRKQMVDIELLDWFNVVCYHEDTAIERYPVPVVYYTGDDLVSAVAAHTFTTPYVAFMNRPGMIGIEPCVWRQRDRIVTAVTQDNGSALIPRDIKQYLKTQIYDYPYIDTSNNKSGCCPLEVIYISNGEPAAEQYWQRLKSICPRAKRSDGVNGRSAAYKAAAELSQTPWFFAVFAKLEVEQDFDFEWQPDLFQQPKHYIFHSRNPVNGLEYGHQGIIAYNKNLVLSNNDPGLDFTLSQPHAVVPVVSGTAHFNQDPWTTWRTAFREVVKLMQYEHATPTVEGRYRLRIWLTQAAGDYAEWSLKGAADAEEYFQSVKGNYPALMLTYEWAWLQDYFKQRNG